MKGETPTVDDYDIGQLLGRGGFASVYRARERKTGLLYAMKIMDKAHIKKHNMETRVQNEIKIQTELKFEGIVEFHCHFEDSEYVYMVLELCEGGNLYRYLKMNGPLNEMGACVVIKQLLLALEYMHGLNVVHRDLKLSNVLLVKNSGDASTSDASLSQCHVKLCDFGLAVQVEHPDEEHFTLCGTPNYIAPEIASQRAHGFPADLWSVGCLFYSILTGAPPFEQAGVKETLQCIITGQYTMPPGLSDQAADFMKCLINLNPLKRHNVTEILDHEFLKLHEIKPAVSENVSRSANGSIIRNESISSIVSPDSKSGSEESSVDPTDRRGSSDISTVDLNESRAPRGSTALSSNSKWRPRSSSSSDRGDLNTLCSDSSSSTSASSALSCSSPAKSIATSGTTVVSEYRASSTGPSKVAQGRNRLGTSPGVEKEFVGRNLSAGSLAARCHDHSGKLTGNYVWDRNGHRRREDAKDLVIKSSGSKREALRGPTLSAEPEMSLQPPTVLPLAPPTAPSSSSGHSPASAARLGMSKSSSTLESSSISSGFDRHQQHNASRCSGDTGIAPTSWLRAIRSIRQSVGDSTGVTSSEAGASSSHSHRSPLSYAMRIDVGGSTGSLRGVLSVAGQIGGSHGRSSGKGLSDGSHHRPHQFQNRPDLPQQHGWTEQCTDSYGRSAARNPLSPHPQQADTTQPYGPRDSLSKSISIENCTMNGPNWFGESSSSASARPPLKQFCFVCPHTAVLVLNEEGMAMYCGIIKDKAGRSLPCRLYSSSRTPNVVTLGKLDEGMLEELKTIWTAQNHGHFSDSDSDSDGESDIESVDEDFFESHRRVLNDSTSSISSEAKTVQASVAKKEASQYSEFESFYNYESDEDEKMEDTSAEDAKKVSEVSQPAVKRRGKSQKKETSSAAMLHAVRDLRLFSDELLLRSYSVSVATSSFSSSSSTRDDCSMDSTRTSMDRRLSLLPPLPAALTALYSKAAEVFEGVRRRVPRIIMYVPAADVAPSVDPATGIALKCSLMSNGPLPDLLCRWANGTRLRYSLQTGSTAIECPPKILPSGLYTPPLMQRGGGSGMAWSSKNSVSCGYSWEGDLISASSSSSSLCTVSPSSTAYSRSLELDLDPNPIPDALKIYLELAQKALKRLLKEDADMSSFSSAFSRSRIRAHGKLPSEDNGDAFYEYGRRGPQNVSSFPRVFVWHL